MSRPGEASYTNEEVRSALTAMEKHRAAKTGELGAALVVVGLCAERMARETRLLNDMMRVAYRAGASLSQLAQTSGLGRRTVTSIVLDEEV